MGSDLRIGVIGAGLRSRLAKHAHQPDAGSRVVSGADVRPAALKKFSEDFEDAALFDDYRRMLDTVPLDAVFITSPDHLHEEHVVAALQKGLAVFLEKPMAITVESCDCIMDAVQSTGGKLYLGHNMRHMPFVREMKRQIDAGAIGEVKAAWCRHFINYGGDAYYKDWHSEQRYVNGLLLQKAVHDIDVMHWLCGGLTDRVVAMGALTLYDQIADRRDPSEPGDPTCLDENWPPLSQTKLSPNIDVEDLNHVLLHLDNGVLMTYQQCHYTPDSARNYTVIGTEGRIENAGTMPGVAEIRIWNRRGHFNEQGDEQVKIPPMEGGHGGADPLIVDEFLAYVRGEVEPSISLAEARAAVAAGALATESLRNGSCPLNVPAYVPSGEVGNLRFA